MIQLQRTTDARKKFRGFKAERPKKVRASDVRDDPLIGELLGRYKKFSDMVEANQETIDGFNSASSEYIKSVLDGWYEQFIGDIHYSAVDIERLTLSAPEGREGELFGSFVDLMLMHGNEKEYRVLCHNWEPNNIGFFNNKKIVVDGTEPVYSVGGFMTGGSIIVNGTAIILGESMEGGEIQVDRGQDVGVRMKGGRIVVLRDANCAGREMEGGIIEVQGNCIYDAGLDMKGGIVVVEGNSNTAGKDMREGTVIIGGNMEYVNHGMKGGKVIIAGNANWVGNSMEDGEIAIFGNCYRAGELMKGGKIMINGDVDRISVGTGGEIHVGGEIGNIEIQHRGRMTKVFQKGVRKKIKRRW